MKFKIWKEKEKNEEKEVFLRFADCTTAEGISVIAVDKDGRRISCGSLLTFEADGVLILQEGINSNLGFQLDSRGRIKLWLELPENKD